MPVDERFERGIGLFNEEAFYECHEVLEDLWLKTQDEYKNLYKGLIQAAVALHHLKRKNLSGARKLYQTSSCYLSQYLPHALGLNVAKLILDLKSCFEENYKFIPKLEFRKTGDESHGLS
ncbi:MAG: DUF309 domain-containing protein [Candidatus Omnitrophica bacterium]|nr:DUF309 domain-containing protein [Candidatus Omnitrophota bacterium]